jgi:hypothetical protein
MAFDGKIVAEHLKELSSRIPGQSILPAFADHLFDIFVERSGNISDVAPEWQRFDIMLIGRYCMDSGKFSVWTLHHFPRDPSLKHHNVRTSFHDYAVAGDTPAKDGALDALKAKHRSIPNMDRSNLQALAHRAIKEGIRKCGPHELCPAAKTAACGGRLFVRFCAR